MEQVIPCVNCIGCGIYIPVWVANIKQGRCINCDIRTWIPNNVATWKGIGYCKYCLSDRALPPIGNSRSNGKYHNDWNGRMYHKKCWKQMKGY